MELLEFGESEMDFNEIEGKIQSSGKTGLFQHNQEVYY